MTAFINIFEKYNWDEVSDKIYSKTLIDVENAIASKKRNLDDFAAIISPAGEAYIEQLALKSQVATINRFGKTIQLFAPMYLSNECNNICTYCGFSYDNKVLRKTLSDKEIIQEAKAIQALGFDNILLVTGEANQTVHVDYFINAIRLLKPFFSSISIEVQPLDTNEYQILQEEGVFGVLVYQETYNEKTYKDYHPKGKKSNFHYRLDTSDRIAKAGLHKIGIGTLLGLDDWRVDSFYTALHLEYLQNNYWKTKYSISFPRIRPAENVTFEKKIITDKQLVQLICAYRLFSEDVELSLSTRESESFRNNVLKLGITSMSAGSKTNPGGYSVEPEALEQFEIDDSRSPADVSKVIKNNGYDPVWKDWEKSFSINL